MKSIMISIRPEWVEKILNKEKTIEIRKTMPSCELPCKVYIYQTKKNFIYKILKWLGLCKGKVVAEFTLNKVEDFSKWEYDYPALLRHLDLYSGTKGNYPFLNNYLKGEKKGYAWHIDNLKIYDKPKELSEFRKDLDCDDYPCNKNCDCRYNYYDHSEGCWACGIDYDGTDCIYKQIKRPPQSYFYVEEMKDE